MSAILFRNKDGMISALGPDGKRYEAKDSTNLQRKFVRSPYETLCRICGKRMNHSRHNNGNAHKICLKK